MHIGGGCALEYEGVSVFVEKSEYMLEVVWDFFFVCFIYFGVLNCLLCDFLVFMM